MKILHLADVHFCKEFANEALKSLKSVEDYIKNNSVDIIAIAGDLFDAAILNSENARLTEFINAIKRLGDTAPVAMVYGTPSHDVDGSLEIFKTLICRYGITVLEPGQAYFLTEMNGKGKIVPEMPGVTGKALILGVPEPRKKYLLTNTSAGKDETEEAIRAAMHRLCYGLAAKRRDYADIPCLFLYHGEVAGTVYQNNQAIERGTGIAITIDELADIDADYYALGHIHKPQKVGNINAYYAGSIYPKNFGETHQASFKIVDIESTIENQRLVTVNTVDFPHPQNMKAEVKKCENYKPGESVTDLKEIIKGKRVWLEFYCTKEQKVFIDTETELQNLLQAGAVTGSRVTISEIAVETVRAAEITEVNTPDKKFEVWAKNSNIDITDSHLKKIKSLISEISQGGALKAEGEWELASIRLKGAIGIMKGIKKEEISVNFDGFDNGVIALVGDNGKGKTTLIENCHPYPQLLTRKGKLQDHFFLKDSLREIVYRNRADGSMLRFLIQIDGQNKSGSCKYFIFKKTAENDWQPLPGIDGNLKDYEAALEAFFGKIELFQRTAFITQRPTKNLPDLTDATAGEKKALFTALSGIDYLQEFCDAANEKAKTEAAKTHDADIKMQMLRSAIDKMPEEEKALKDAEGKLSAKKKELDGITKKGKVAKAEMETCQTAWNAEQVRQQQESEAKASVETLSMDIQNLTLDIDTLTEASENKTRYEKEIAEYEAQQKIVDAENAKKQEVTEANLQEQQKYAKLKTDYDESIKKLEVERDNLCDIRNNTERQIADAENNIKLLESGLENEQNKLCKPFHDKKAEFDRDILQLKSRIELYEKDAAEITNNCPYCGHELTEDKLAELAEKRNKYVALIDEANARIKNMEADAAEIPKIIEDVIRKAAEQCNAKIEKEKADIVKLNDKLTAYLNRIDELQLQLSETAFDEPEEPKLTVFDDAKLKAAIEKQKGIDITQTRAALAQAQEASVRIDGLQKQIVDKKELLKAKEAEYERVKQASEHGAKIKADLDAATARHTELTEQYTSVKSEIAATEASITAVKKTIAEIAEKEKEYAELKQASQTAATEGLEWEMIAKAFGKDGIQALELDALAPGISDTANRILESAYGDRFRIEIRTTRIGGAGKKTKQIEDFLIYVIDSEDGEAVLLDDKSGGEAVWIKRAIYDAFAVIRKRNTNFIFLTCFQDETDGALDSASKTSYCKMLEAAHAENKLRHTIVITHSNEVKAMIEQKIDMAELAA